MAKWIEFVAIGTSKSGLTQVWTVHPKDSTSFLGQISWYARWRKYVFAPTPVGTPIFEEQCLRDIAAFIQEKTREHREASKLAKAQ